MRSPVEGFLLAVSAALDSLSFAVTVLPALLTFIIERPFPIIVVLVCVSVSIALHRRSRLCWLKLSENGAQIDVRRLLRRLTVYSAGLVELINSCHGGIVVEPGCWRLLCYRLGLRLWRLLLEVGELGEDCF